MLATLGLADLRHDILFSDGNDPARDLQFFDPAFQIPAANRLIAQICGQEDGLEDEYRTHQVPGIGGPSTRQEIERGSRRCGLLHAGDRLLIYFTGHGGKGNDESSNHMHLWNGEKLTVKNLVEQLDHFRPKSPWRW